MNNTFQWSRFGKLLRKDFLNVWTMYGSTMLGFISLPLVLWICDLVINGGAGYTEPAGRIVFILFISVFVALMAPKYLYGSCNRKGDGIYFAMLPASKLEKFISMIIFCFIVAPLLVFCGSSVVDMILSAFPFGPYRQFLFDLPSFYYAYPATEINETAWAIAYCIVSYCAWVATFFFTNTVFKKHKFVGTILTLFVITVILILFYSIFNPSFEFLARMAMNNPIALLWTFLSLGIVYTLGLLVWSFFRLKKMAY